MLANTLLSVDEFITRRTTFMAGMPENSVAIFSAAQEVTRSNDTEYPFCQNKNFYYLTGFEEPDAILFLIKKQQCKSVLFCREKDPLQEVWHGRRIGAELAQSTYAFDESYPLTELDELAGSYLANVEQLWRCRETNTVLDEKVNSWFSDIDKKAKQGLRSPKISFDCRDVINEMRLIK